MMYRFMTLYEASLLYYQKAASSAVNRNLASVINNQNDSSKCSYELVNSYIYFHGQYDLFAWVTNMI